MKPLLWLCTLVRSKGAVCLVIVKFDCYYRILTYNVISLSAFVCLILSASFRFFYFRLVCMYLYANIYIALITQLSRILQVNYYFSLKDPKMRKLTSSLGTSSLIKTLLPWIGTMRNKTLTQFLVLTNS